MRAIRRGKKSKVKSKNNRLRLSVFRSLENIYAQIINDENGKTLVSASSLKLKNGGRSEGAKEVGKMIAEAAKKEKIETVVFDRGNKIYHGRIRVLADAARKHGLKF